jgi:cyanate permease
MRTLCGIVFLGFGIFVALATWLQTLLHPSHVSDTTAGVLLVGTIIAGVVGCAVIPPLVDRRHSERRFMLGVVAASLVGSVALGAIPWVGGRAVALAAMGLFLLPALPVVLSGAERLAGTAAAGTAGAIVWMAGNLGGLVVAVIVQILVHHPLAAFLSLAVVSAFGAPLALRLPGPAGRPAPASAT